MAHTLDTHLRFTGSGNPLTSAYTCGAGTTVLTLSIVLGATASAPARTGGAPTYNGVALTQAGSTQVAAAAPETQVELWYLLAPPTGSSLTISVPNTGVQSLFVNATTFKAGAGKTSALDQTGGGNNTSTNPTASVTTQANGEAIISVIGSGAQIWAPTAQDGTNFNNTDDGAFGDGNQYLLQTSAGTQAMGYTFSTSEDWAICIASFYEVGTPLELAATTFLYDANLVAYYRMEGNSNDSKSSNTGTDTAITYGAGTGEFGQGAAFNGTTSVITLPNLGISGSTARTVSFWVKKGAANTIKSMIGWSNNPSVALEGFVIHTGAVAAGDVYAAFNANDYYTPGSVINTSTFTHVAVVYDGGTLSTSTVHIYINGIAKVLSVSVSSAGAANTTDTNYEIGSDVLSASRFFDGTSDDVAIFNRALSATEVMAIFQGTSPSSKPIASIFARIQAVNRSGTY